MRPINQPSQAMHLRKNYVVVKVPGTGRLLEDDSAFTRGYADNFGVQVEILRWQLAYNGVDVLFPTSLEHSQTCEALTIPLGLSTTWACR